MRWSVKYSRGCLRTDALLKKTPEERESYGYCGSAFTEEVIKALGGLEALDAKTRNAAVEPTAEARGAAAEAAQGGLPCV